MRLDYYKKFSSEYPNCRIKSLRDMFLLYGYDLPYEILELLSLGSIINVRYLKYKSIKYPGISPYDNKCDINILESLFLNYTVLNPVFDDKSEIDSLLNSGKPLISYYSKNALFCRNPQLELIGFVNTLILIQNKHEKYYTNAKENRTTSAIKWEDLWRARNSTVLPYSPERTIIYLNDSNDFAKFNDKDYLFSLSMNSVKKFCNNYIQEFDNGDFVSDSRSYRAFFQYLTEFRNEISSFKEFSNAQRYFYLGMQIIIRYMNIRNKEDSFNRQCFVNSIKFVVKHLHNKDLNSWYEKSSSIVNMWINLVQHIINSKEYIGNINSINIFFDKLIKGFLDIEKEEKDWIEQLQSTLTLF